MCALNTIVGWRYARTMELVQSNVQAMSNRSRFFSWVRQSLTNLAIINGFAEFRAALVVV